MVNKSSLAKKLASYSAVATAILAVNRNADAQIIYTAVNPAFVGHDTTYLLDLNGDGIADFKISQTQKSFRNSTTNGYFESAGGEEFVNVVALNSNALIGKPYNYGSAINANPISSYGWNQWLSLSYSKWREWGDDGSSFGGGGAWYYTRDTSYLPLRLNVSGNIYYGWARLYVEAREFTLTGYAYNSTPDSEIYAGQECNIQFPKPVISQNDDTLITTATTNVQWYFNNTPISGATVQKLFTKQYGIYSVTAGDTTICHGISLSFNYINCSTYSFPDIVTSGNLVCNNQPITLAIDTIPDYYSVQWLKNDSAIFDENNNVLYTGTGGNYSVVISEPRGCSDTSSVVQITLDTNLIYPSIIQSTDTLFFVPYRGSFPDKTVLQWYNIDTLIKGATTTNYLPPDTGIYKITETDSLGCSGTTNFDYQVCKNLHCFITSTTKAVCNYNWVTLASDSVPSDYITEWFLNNNISDYGAETHTWKPGSFYAVIYELGGCYDTTNIINLPLDTTHYKPIVTQHGDTLISNYTTGNTWRSDVMTLTNDSGQAYLPTQHGYYYVIYTDSLGCSTSSSEYYYSGTTTGIKNSTSSEIISIYPNPATNQLSIISNQLPIVQIQIDDVLGQTIYQSPLGNLGVKQTVDVSSLPVGMYFYRITTSDLQVSTGKFVKG